jgi:hypothetical protein
MLPCIHNLQLLIKLGHAFAGKIIAAAAKHDLPIFKSNQRPDVMQRTGSGFKVKFYGRVVHNKVYVSAPI